MEPSTVKKSQPTANQKIARAAGTVMAAYIFVNILNLARNIVILRTFGTGAELDSFYAANRIGEFIFNIVAGGALASAFVPTFTGLITKKETKAAWKMASAVVNWVILITGILSLLAAIFAPLIVQYVLAPGFTEQPEQFLLTVQLMRVTLISVTIFAVSGLVMGILNAHQSFLFPALAPGMYSIGQIIGVLVLAPFMGIFGLAWGAVLGASLHLLIQIPKLIRLRGKYALQLGINDAHVREVGWLMLPRLVGVSLVQINFVVNTNLASGYQEGSVTGLSSGFALMLLPLNFIAQAIGTASLPTLSEQFALGKLDEMRASFSSAVRSVLLLSIPASVGLVMLRFPLIRVMYENNSAFDSLSTEMVAWALLWYGVGLVGHSVLEIVVRAFYAQNDTKTPVMIGAGAMLLNIILSILLGGLFIRIGWFGHGGLALANSIATALEVCILLWLMRDRLNGIDGRKIMDLTWRAAVSAVLMGAAIYFFLGLTEAYGSFVQLIGGVVGGVLVYGGAALLLRMRELDVFINLIKNKVLARLGNRT